MDHKNKEFEEIRQNSSTKNNKNTSSKGIDLGSRPNSSSLDSRDLEIVYAEGKVFGEAHDDYRA